MSVWVWVAVALLGGAGAVARFVLDTVISRRWSGDLPFGTLIINLSGAFGLGLMAGLGLTGHALLLAGTATVGAYTTFSTWMLESHRLAEDGIGRIAALNIGLSVVVGVAAAALGRAIG